MRGAELCGRGHVTTGRQGEGGIIRPGFSGFPNISTLIQLHICDMPLLERIGSMSLGKLEGLKELHICNNIKLKQLHESALVREDEENWVWPVLEKVGDFPKTFRSLSIPDFCSCTSRTTN